MFTIDFCTWSPSSQNVKIGCYNVYTGVTYTVTYDGGEIDGKRINSIGSALTGALNLTSLPDGEYRFIMYSSDNRNINAAMLYQFQ